MQPLNAIDAITPAFTRTHELLFSRPRNYGRTWKLCATSYLAYGGSVFFPFPLLLFFVLRMGVPVPAGIVTILWTSVAVLFLIYLGLLYCCSRLEFVEFELLVTRQRMVAPAWRRYGQRTWAWLLTKVVVGTVVCALLAPFAVSVGRDLVKALPALLAQQQGVPPNAAVLGAFLHGLFGFYAFLLVLMLSLKLFSTVLNDFVLPFYALEDVSLGTAVQRGWAVILADPLQVLGYLVMKPVLAIAGFLMVEIAWFVCLIPIGLVFGVIAFLGFLVLHAIAGGAAQLLLVAGGVLLYLVLYVVFLAVLIGLFGYLLNLLGSYGIYFLGGRYPMLGNLLQPEAANYTYAPPPSAPPPDEDEDGGPSLPMDPALA